jgi:hypothetical protein
MNTSEKIAQLAEALSKAQGEFESMKKSGINPLFKNEYATLDDVINAIRVPLSEHGLSFMQPLVSDGSAGFKLETVILHASGEWISSTSNIPILAGNRGTNELQTFGSALTYMRRYMLTSMLGINSETDNDGSSITSTKTTTKATQKPVGRDVKEIIGASDKQRFEVRRRLEILGGKEVDAQLKAKKYPPLSDLTSTQADKLIERLKVSHWINNDATRKKFWASVEADQDAVHAALNVEHMIDCLMTLEQAIEAVKAHKEAA